VTKPVIGERISLSPRGRSPVEIAVAASAAVGGEVEAMSFDVTPPASGDLTLTLAEWWPATAEHGDRLVWRVETPGSGGVGQAGPVSASGSMVAGGDALGEPSMAITGAGRVNNAAALGRAGPLVDLPEVGSSVASSAQILGWVRVAVPEEVAGVAVAERALTPELGAELLPGMTFRQTFVVTPEQTTGHVLGRPAVLSTPHLLAWLENTAQKLTVPYLARDVTTVGVRLDVAHRASAIAGETVEFDAVLVGRWRRRLAYLVQATVGDRLLGNGRHEAHIVPHGG
jgi:fluoroacetyl-CoA thioesterase